MRRLLMGGLCILCVPIFVFAHSTGASFESQVGSYFVDIGYDPALPRLGETVVLDFSLSRTADREPVPFDRIWVRIESASSTLIATGVSRSSFGPTSLLMRLPQESSSVTVHARFERGDIVLGESSFDLPLAPARNSHSLIPRMPALAAAGIGLVLGIFMMWIRARRMVH